MSNFRFQIFDLRLKNSFDNVKLRGNHVAFRNRHSTFDIARDRKERN